MCSTQLVPYQRMQILGTEGRIEVEIPFNAPPDKPCRIFVDDGSALGDASAQEEAFPVCDQYGIQGDLFSEAIPQRQAARIPAQAPAVQNSCASSTHLPAPAKTGAGGGRLWTRHFHLVGSAAFGSRPARDQTIKNSPIQSEEPGTRRLTMRDKSLRLSILASAAIAVAGAAVATARADMMSGRRQGRGEVAIVAWAGYIERGETDKAYDWVTGFEKDTGCKVTVKVAGDLGRDGLADERRRLRPRHRLGRRLLAARRRRHGAGDQHRAGAELRHRRSAAAERALAHGRRQALRRALSVGLRTC